MLPFTEMRYWRQSCVGAHVAKHCDQGRYPGSFVWEGWNLLRVATLIQYGPELHQGHNPDPKLTENTLVSRP